jgi:hypothetical protein
MATTDTITLKIAPASISRQVITVATGDYGYTVPFIVQDADGDAQNLTGYTVTLHLWLPATPSTLAIDETCTQDTPASGTCHYVMADGDLDTAGTYLGELELTKAGEELSTEQFIVVVQTNASSYCTLADVKDALDITGTDHDDLLSSLISAVTSEIDNYCERSFASASATRYFDGVGDNLIVDDLVSVTTFKLDAGGDGVWETTLTEGTDFLLYPYNTSPKWLVKLTDDSTASSFAKGVRKGVEIAGTWGYSTVPEPVRQAALIQTCRLFRLSQSGYGTEIGTPDIGTATVFQGLSSDAKRMLGPYVRVEYV